jgi:hypothetical protein
MPVRTLYRIAAGFALVALVPLAALTYFGHAAATAALTEEVHKRLESVALLQSDRARGLLDDARGVVINLLDQKLENPNPDFFSYTLSKAALKEATMLLAIALAPKVRVVGIAPGITLASNLQSDTGFAEAHRRTPLNRSSTPNDVAQAAVYLANAEAVTGTVLLVDGGQHLVPSSRDVMFLTESQTEQ